MPDGALFVLPDDTVLFLYAGYPYYTTNSPKVQVTQKNVSALFRRNISHVPPHTLFRGDSMFLQLLQQVFFFFLHVAESGSFRKPLTKQEESDCFNAMAQGDRHARERLILYNMRLVVHITKKYGVLPAEQEELISIGTIGLVKAVDSFDNSKGARFATYASRCIENEILMNFRAQKKHADQLYMGEPIDTDSEGNQLTLMDIMDDGSDLPEMVDTLIQSQQLYQYLQNCLTPREAEILVQRYGLYGKAPMTQREISKKMGISRSYVSRIEKHAIEKLRLAYQRE